MNSESIKTFIAVTELKSFTKAAQQLIVVQSTITNRIKELEKELGQPLFVRDSKNITLTHAGKHFYQYAQSFIELEDKMKTEISSCNTFSKIINIGAVNCIYNCHLAPYISTFINLDNSTCMNITLDHSRNLLNRLHDNFIDICFSYLPTNGTNYKCIPFRSDDIILVTNSKNDMLSHGIHHEQLLSLPIIYSKFIPKSGFDWLDDIFPTNYVFQFTISVIKEIIPLLLQSCFYAFLPRSLIHKEIEYNLLREIPLLDYNIPPLKSYVITKSNYNQELIDYFLNELL